MSIRWYRQPAPIVFKVTGKDARRYLNNRLSNDLRSCVSGDSLLAAALSPQGRVEGLFTVYVQPNDVFYLACDGGERQPLFAALGRYIVADRVSIVDCSSEALVCHIAGVTELSFSGDAIAMRSPRNRVGIPGEDLLCISPSVSVVYDTLVARLGAPLSTKAYDIARFQSGFSQFPTEVNEGLILTEAGLRDAVSFQKGCYVGQEVIERSDAIGKLPRHVERIVCDEQVICEALTPVIGKEDRPIGKVLSVIPCPESGRAFVFALLKTGAYSVGDSVRCGGVKGRILSSEEGGAI